MGKFCPCTRIFGKSAFCPLNQMSSGNRINSLVISSTRPKVLRVMYLDIRSTEALSWISTCLQYCLDRSVLVITVPNRPTERKKNRSQSLVAGPTSGRECYGRKWRLGKCAGGPTTVVGSVPFKFTGFSTAVLLFRLIFCTGTVHATYLVTHSTAP